MLDQATAFSYTGEDRAKLNRLGLWVQEVLARRSRGELRELATSITHNRYEDLIELAYLLRQPGLRLVVFEDRAMQLCFLVMRLLQDEQLSYTSDIGMLASPLLNDMRDFIAKAKSEQEGYAVCATG